MHAWRSGSRPDRLTAVDLFSGAGGITLGLTNAGFDVVFCSDHDESCARTHRRNFPTIPLARESVEKVRAADILRDSVPELKAVLPPTAIGKDYPYRGEWVGLTPSRTGVFVSLGGYLGLTVGWVEGVELNFLGGVLGLDIRRPALKFPGLGRLGVPQI